MIIKVITNIVLNTPTKNGRIYNEEAIEKIVSLIIDRAKNGNPIPVLQEDSGDNHLMLDRFFGVVKYCAIENGILFLSVLPMDSVEINGGIIKLSEASSKMIRVGSRIIASVCDDDDICQNNGWKRGVIYGVEEVHHFYIEHFSQWLQVTPKEETLKATVQ